MNFNGSISILKDITGVKLIQFNTGNNFPVPSWVIFSVKCLNCCCRAEDGGAAWEMELCCLLMPALPLFCHSACLLQQSQGDLLICSFAGFISRAEVVVTQRSRLEIVHLFKNRIICSWEAPGPFPCLSVSCCHAAAVHFHSSAWYQCFGLECICLLSELDCMLML